MKRNLMRRTNGLALAASLVLLPAMVEAQELTSDRPDFTESVVVVKRVQLESGYTMTRAGGYTRHAVGELLLRLGVMQRLELRLSANSYVLTRGPLFETNGIEDAGIGAKLSLTPRSALIVSASIPTGSSSETSDGIAPDVLLALEQPLGETVGLGMNLSLASEPGVAGRNTSASGSIVLGADAGTRTGLFAELYGTRVLDGPLRDHTVFADAGVTRSITADLQLDARIGRRLNGGDEWYFGVGLVRRW
jgi:hypothetical protein